MRHKTSPNTRPDEWEQRQLDRFRKWLAPRNLADVSVEDLRRYVCVLAASERLCIVARRIAAIRTLLAL